MKNNWPNKIREELRKRIIDFDKYNFSVKESNGIIAVQPIGSDFVGHEAEVDAGGRNFERVMGELIPKVINLIKVYKEKSHGK